MNIEYCIVGTYLFMNGEGCHRSLIRYFIVHKLYKYSQHIQVKSNIIIDSNMIDNFIPDPSADMNNNIVLILKTICTNKTTFFFNPLIITFFIKENTIVSRQKNK